MSMTPRSPLPEQPANISCIEVGNGPPLVIFPGLARRPVTNRLPYLGLARITKRRIHVINRPFGLPRGLTMPQLAAVHAQIIAKRFAEPVDLLGSSTGGAIALQLAVDHPAVVNRLVIAASASWLGEDGRKKLRSYADEVGRGRSGAKILASVLASPAWAGLAAPIIWVSHVLERGSNANDMLATIDAEVGFDVTPQLGRIRAATLLIAGAQDRAFPLTLVEATAAGIPNSRLIVYPKAGHVGTMMNRRFGPDVAAFLGTTPG